MRFSKTEFADVIGVSRQTLYAYIKKGILPVDADGKIDSREALRALERYRNRKIYGKLDLDLDLSHLGSTTWPR